MKSIIPIPKNCFIDLDGPSNIPFIKNAIKEYDKLLKKKPNDSELLFIRGYAKRYLSEHWKPNLNSTKKSAQLLLLQTEVDLRDILFFLIWGK